MFDPISIIEGSSDAAFVIDGELRVMAWNAQAEALLGVSRFDAKWQTCYGLVDGRTVEGRLLCTPGCAAIQCFARGIPYAHSAMLIRSARGERVAVQAGSIVLEGPVAKGVPKAIIFLRPSSAMTATDNAAGPLLHVYVMGSLRIHRSGQDVDWRTWPRRQAVTLLKVLLNRRGRPVHRETLVEVLWPEVAREEGLKRLKVVVHTLRRCLEPELSSGAASRFLFTVGEGYQLAPDERVWVDAEQFLHLSAEGDRQWQRGETASAASAYQAAADLYLGDYLEDDPYQDDLVLQRERLRETYLIVLARLASYLADTGEPAQAIGRLSTALKADPCREAVHRLLMLCLWKAGRRDEALRQYQACRETLERELGVAPMAETHHLFERILRTEYSTGPAAALASIS